MTRILQDILNQPNELRTSLDYTLGPGRDDLEHIAEAVASAPVIYITGMGASMHATLAVQSLFVDHRHKVHAIDAAELWHNIPLREQSAIVILSRSGKSAEVVGLLDKVKAAEANLVAITNDPTSPIAQSADFTIPLRVAYDYNVSITMYTALSLVGGLLAEACEGRDLDYIGDHLRGVLEQIPSAFETWRTTLAGHSWFNSDGTTCFVARGGSIASCNEAGLMWEEVVKGPALAMSTGNFRHGPAEVLRPGTRLGIWFSHHLRDEDIALARDAKEYGASIMAIGQDLPADSGDLIFNLPRIDYMWQFLTDIMPVQLCCDHYSQLNGVDGDHLNICSYVVESQGGLYFPEKKS